MELPKKKIITSKLVKVLVGRDSSSQQHVDIHEGLLRHNSAFCNNALNSAQAQSPSRRVKKPETNPDIFEIWVEYAYTRRIFINQPGKDTIEHLWLRWSACYAILQCPDFLDACIDACFEILSDTLAMHKELPGWI
ncbi:hypothetical protein HBI53_110090 [Parastagonospora nodorum]|nr:hypothetical protein HBI53_110090 [Parastagonospora nodorum]